MLKRTLLKTINSFCYSIAIMVTVYLIMMLSANHFPMLPEYIAHFRNETAALLVQLFLIGVMSAATAAGTVLLELEHLSLLVQSILYLIFCLCFWIPIACFCWGLHKYALSLISFLISFLVSYCISWIISYRLCKQAVNDINQKLASKAQ